MNVTDIWNKEKELYIQCINEIEYDEFLVSSLEKLIIDIERCLIEKSNSFNDVKVIIDTLDSSNYINNGLFTKATEEEKELVFKLKESLYVLYEVLQVQDFDEKEDVIIDKYYNYEKKESLPKNDKESIDRFKEMYSNSMDIKDYNPKPKKR